MTSSQPLKFDDPGFHPDVRNFYRAHNGLQTYRRARELAGQYAERRLGRATVLGRFEALDMLRDASDGDLQGLSQLGHALQTTDAIRQTGMGEDWLLLGLIHDLGKLLMECGEAPEFVVGDTFPVGCTFSPNIRHAEFFEANPDSHKAEFQDAFVASTRPDGVSMP